MSRATEQAAGSKRSSHDEKLQPIASKGLMPAAFPTADMDLFLAQESLSASRYALQPLTRETLHAWRVAHEDNSPLAEPTAGMYSNSKALHTHEQPAGSLAACMASSVAGGVSVASTASRGHGRQRPRRLPCLPCSTHPGVEGARWGAQALVGAPPPPLPPLRAACCPRWTCAPRHRMRSRCSATWQPAAARCRP